MAIKRRILSFSDFKKGKNSLENPEKHPIKEGETTELKPHVIGEPLMAFLGTLAEAIDNKTNEKVMVASELVKGDTYKVYDLDNNGALVYSAARFEGKEAKGNKFVLVNKPKEMEVYIKADAKMDFVPTTYVAKKK